MPYFLVRWLVLMLAIFVAANLSFLGIRYDSLGALAVAALVLGVVNAVVRPVLMLISLPFILFSFGIFILIINALLFYFVGWLVSGFHVDTFWSALGGSLVVSLVGLFFGGGKKARTVVRRAEQERREPPPGDGPVIDI